MAVKRLREFLDTHHIEYEVVSHSPAYTAQGIAAAAHVSGLELAKTVMIKVDGKMAMAVVPAPYKVDLAALKKEVGSDRIELATEKEFEGLFPGCETGAMPPFGNLYGMNVYVSSKLAEDEVIAFNAGSHTELVKMSYRDFGELVHPSIFDFAARKA